MKRILIRLLSVVAVIGIICIFVASAPIDSDSSVYKTILPSTPIFKEADINSEVLESIPQNAPVEIIDEVFVNEEKWVKVKYTAYEGYMLFSSLYLSAQNGDYSVRHMTVISRAMGSDVALYESHYGDAEAVATVHDGEKVKLILNGVDYGDFSYIEYDGEFYFIETAHITDGLGYNQRLAVIISCTFGGILVVVIIGVILIRKRKY